MGGGGLHEGGLPLLLGRQVGGWAGGRIAGRGWGAASGWAVATTSPPGYTHLGRQVGGGWAEGAEASLRQENLCISAGGWAEGCREKRESLRQDNSCISACILPNVACASTLIHTDRSPLSSTPH